MARSSESLISVARPPRLSGIAAAALALGLMAGCATRPGEDAPLLSLEGKPLSGSVTMEEVQIAYLGSAGGGHGTLSYHGRRHRFSVAGLGVGGIGISSIDAVGEVYNLTSIADFPGAYVQGRVGFAVGEASSGDLWLQNDHGVIMHLKAKRTGLMLSLGGDAVVITMSE